MQVSGLRARVAILSVLGFAAVAAIPPVVATDSVTGRSSERELSEAAEGQFEALEAAEQYAEARTAPADEVDAGAFIGAYADAANLPVVGGPWSEITTQPYDSDAPGYRDPVWSNSGGGAGLVGGRTTTLALDGDVLYAGSADGGVWKRTNGNWTPLLDDAPSLSIGDIKVNNHDLWVGTGEANTSSDSYAGTGVLVSTDGGSNFSRVGGDELQNTLVRRIVFDGAGHVYAATSKGLFRRSLSAPLSEPWTRVLYPSPCPQSGATPDTRYVSDVVVRPGTGGQQVIAVMGWRAGSVCNGFYRSNDFGQTFSRISVGGSLNDKDLGRTTLAYASDGSKLYALVQSASMFNHAKTDFGGTVLMGVFVSPNGNPAGSYQKIAEWRKLANSGSALKAGLGYHPGVQAWYNQFLAVDPNDADHVYLGLEESFETTNGGTTWKAIGPYWNFTLPCAANGLDSCGKTPHPDQHAIVIDSDRDRVYIGNDGGVYSRSLDNHSHDGTEWTNLNSGYRTLQYYYAEAGKVAGGDAIWGGLQDNGVSLLSPDAPAMVSPFGGDGGDNIVDHENGDRAVNEYVGLDMALTTNGGRSDGTSPSYREISPSCSALTYTPDPCDPLPRFIAPFEADTDPVTHWVAGGKYVWDNQNKGWDTRCGADSCDWVIVGDSGAGHSITQIGIAQGTWYAAWCGPCNADGFTRGILTNYGGTVHQLSLQAPEFPSRFIQGVTVDPTDPAHAYVVFNGFSRRWTNTFSAGEGHVFETLDGGQTWTDISGSDAATALPDAPGDDLVMTDSGMLVVGTDIGVFVASAGQGADTTWSRLGTGLPHASTNDLQLSPDGDYIIAATHGRGLWKLATP
jgi:photosystem II stability/assembly factor-like uncharacterized protein